MAISVLFAEANQFAVGWAMSSHAHPAAHELILVLAGTLDTTFADDGPMHRATAGTAVWHPPGVAHAEAVAGGAPLRTWFLSWRGDGPEASAPRLSVDRQARLAAGLAWAADLWTTRTVASLEALDALVPVILHEFSRAALSPDEDLVHVVRTYAEAHLAEPLRLDDLAQVAAMSRAHFARRFHQASGRTPMAFVRELRLDAGRQLLMTTRLTIDAIAERVGFPDRFHFARSFRRQFGTAPSAIRH